MYFSLYLIREYVVYNNNNFLFRIYISRFKMTTTIKCECDGKIWSLGTNRFICSKCKKKFKRNCKGNVGSFEDLEEM